MSKKETQRILIWGKTYPELSDSYKETVCTGGCLENGSPVRIYPVPFRYLPNFKQYQLYQWIEAPIWPSEDDPRPESYKIDASKIVTGDRIDTDPGWMHRREIIFRDESWHYNSVAALQRDQEAIGRSLGFVPVGRVDQVYIEERPTEEKQQHQSKLEAKQSQINLFDDETRLDLEFQDFRIRVKWRCGQPSSIGHCNGHDTAILDWGLGELGRREGRASAKSRMEEICNVEKYDLRFYLGNIFRFPSSFTVVGVWYPKRSDVRDRSAPLFE